LLRVPKSGQLVHAHRDAHDRLGENALDGEQCRRRSCWSLTRQNDTTIPLRNTDQPATENTMEKRPCLVWWPRIWTRNTVEPTWTSGTGRDSWDGWTSMTCSYETREVTGAGDWLAQNPEVATAEYA